MALSVSCPNCGKRFKNIKPEYAGKNAKCACGNIVRLSAKLSKPTKPTQLAELGNSDSSISDDLMEVDLLGDELLGDELLSNELFGDKLPSDVSVDHQEGQSADPVAPAKTTQHDQVSIVDPFADPATASDQERSKPIKEKKRRRFKPRRQPASTRQATDPQDPLNPQEPIFNQSYSDLESILEGIGDAAPIAVRPPDEDDQAEEQSAPSSKQRQGSPIGLLSALLSGTLAFWFGVFALISKFAVVEWSTIGFSQTLHRVYNGEFGDGELSALELSRGYQVLFSVYGWVFWSLAVCLMVFGAAQFLNSLYRLITKRHFFRRIDGWTATSGVVVLFLMVGWVFAQSSLQREQHKFLNEYEKPATVNGESLEVVTQLRDKVDGQHRVTRNWILVGALVPMSVFVLSMTRLLTLSSDRRRGSG